MYYIRWKEGVLQYRLQTGGDWKCYTMLPPFLVKPDIKIEGIKISKGYATMQYLIKNNLAVYLQDIPNYGDD